MTKEGRKSLFDIETKFQKYKDIVCLKDPECTRESIALLNREFKSAKQRDKKIRIARVTQLAANRAFATLGRKNLSQKERKEFKQIGNLYSKAAKWFWKKID